MATISMSDVIEPSAGAARKVSTAARGGVHQLWNSDEYRNVWWCVPLDALGHEGVKDAASIDAARRLLQRIKAHSDPVLRHYGWTVKHLYEHCARGPGGMCYHDNQGTADISLQLRSRPDKSCTTFRSFHQLMGVMLHEMTHIAGLGVEDIHPPEFFEKMREVRATYRRLLDEGAIQDPAGEGAARAGGGDGGGGDDYGDYVEGGCRTRKRSAGGMNSKRKRKRRAGAPGAVGVVGPSSAGASFVPAPRRQARGRKHALIDKRTREGKRIASSQAAHATPAEAARAAALARFGQPRLSHAEQNTKRLRAAGGSGETAIELSSSSDEDGDEDVNGADDGGSGGSPPRLAPMGVMIEHGSSDEDYSDEEGEERDDDVVEVHDGPPGLCTCAMCGVRSWGAKCP